MKNCFIKSIIFHHVREIPLNNCAYNSVIYEDDFTFI